MPAVCTGGESLSKRSQGPQESRGLQLGIARPGYGVRLHPAERFRIRPSASFATLHYTFARATLPPLTPVAAPITPGASRPPVRSRLRQTPPSSKRKDGVRQGKPGATRLSTSGLTVAESITLPAAVSPSHRLRDPASVCLRGGRPGQG
ncbi:unnamed protein product [Gadus morhua 'NCC']